MMLPQHQKLVVAQQLAKEAKKLTSFASITEKAFEIITDDNFKDSLQSYDEFLAQGAVLIERALPSFRFPRFDIYDIEEVNGAKAFRHDLTIEEQLILTQLVALGWLEQQVMTTDLIRQEVYASSDFKKTSQASHLSRLNSLQQRLAKDNQSQQFWYGRRVIGSQGGVSKLSGLAGGKTNA